jgi:PAS domain S-box-containing protein
MENILKHFTNEIGKVTHAPDVFQILVDCFQHLHKDIFSVCLKIDMETFEIVPVRDIDRILMKNIQKSIDKGICGQVLEPNKIVILTDQERFAMRENENFILIPLTYNRVQFGIVVVVFPKSLCEEFEEIREDLNGLSVIASHYMGLSQAFLLEQEVNRQHVEIEGRLNNIVQNVVHGLMTLDTNNVVTIFNKNAEFIFGIAASSVIGKSYRESFSDKLVRSFDILVESTLIEGSILDYEVEVDISPSLTIPVGISSSILYDPQGIQQGIIFVCRDMSLTREVNRLKDLDKMKSEFVSMVSHELKNPIAIIKSSVETLQAARRLGKSLGADFENNTLVSIHEEINRLSQLINDILNLARIESGKVEIKKEPTNIERLLESIAHMYKIHEETHPITVKIEEAVPKSVLLDPDKIKQVLINYVGNAVKYSPKGCAIEMKAAMDGANLKVAVSDSGIGIPDDKKDAVFQKFSRISTPETQSISGTGLGLSICKKIIELHRGSVWFESQYQKGSTFGFTLLVTGIDKDSAKAAQQREFDEEKEAK